MLAHPTDNAIKDVTDSDLIQIRADVAVKASFHEAGGIVSTCKPQDTNTKFKETAWLRT